MIRSGKYTTLLLVAIVLILLFGVGIALYYVLGLDWFGKRQVDIYSEQPQVTPYKEVSVEVVKDYDITKRAYNLQLSTDDMNVVVYKNGTVGVTLKDNGINNQVSVYSEIIGKEIKPALTNIVKVYEVYASENETRQRFVVLLDSTGNVYKLSNTQLSRNGKIVFVKIQGLAKIVDIKQITNDGVIENMSGINAIAIDNEQNELLLTNYLLED